MQDTFKSMDLKADGFSCFLDVLTENTFIMVIVTDRMVMQNSAAIARNIQQARKHFEVIESTK